jgi:rubrerythrin
MTVERALRESLRYEHSIRDLYTEAARGATEDAARNFYRLLGKDEQSHVDYLEHKLTQWKEKGIVTHEGLLSGLPDAEKVEAAVRRAGLPLGGRDLGGHVEALSRALKAEEETSSFYRSLVAGVEGEASPLFARFLEIEEGHTRIVRAELDLATRTGHWFDMKEFDLED